MSEHYCKNCKKSNGNNTCSLTGALHTTGIECPSFGQKLKLKESEMSNETNRMGQEPDHPYTPPTEAGHDARTFVSHPEGVLRATESGVFKIGDSVRVIADAERLKMCRIYTTPLTGKIGRVDFYNPTAGSDLKYKVRVGDTSWNLDGKDLELIEEEVLEIKSDGEERVYAVKPPLGPIRTFDSGAKEVGSPIPGFPGYSVTKDGLVWSEKSNKWLAADVIHTGHLRVRLYDNGKSSKQPIHRLVLETYVGPCPDGMECRHLNGNPADNRLENLKWGTSSENHKDAVKHGTQQNLYESGEKHPRVVLTEQEVMLITYMSKTGKFTNRDIAELYGVVGSTISAIITKRSWRHLWQK